MKTTVYVVFIPLRQDREGGPNTQVLAVKLTASAARRLVDQVPGAWMEKHTADKL